MAIGLFDRVVPPAELDAQAIEMAHTLAASAAHGRVNEQFRATTCARLARIVEEEDDPLLDGWL